MRIQRPARVETDDLASVKEPNEDSKPFLNLQNLGRIFSVPEDRIIEYRMIEPLYSVREDSRVQKKTSYTKDSTSVSET